MTDRDDVEANEPLDPQTERLRRKMVRLLAVSVATMLVGVMAVLGAIVYKATRPRAVAAAPGAILTIDLPASARIAAMALQGDEALLQLAPGDPDGVALVRVDLATGAVIGRYRLAAGAAPGPPAR